MKYITAALTFLLLLHLFSCQAKEEPTTEPPHTSTDSMAEAAQIEEYYVEGTVFHYGELDFELTDRAPMVNAVMSTAEVGDKIVIECHVGPKNGVYCIFDTSSRTFLDDIMGCNLTWHSDDITTAVYSFWSDVCAYDGSVIESFTLAESEFIYDLTFSGDHTGLTVTIVGDGTERTEIIGLVG